MALYHCRFHRLFLSGLLALAFLLTLAAGRGTCQVQGIPATGQVPFTRLPYNNDSDKVQFAIVSDLWGGYRAGVFEDAVGKLELLQPQFVISVGDLINGKTYDTMAIARQWEDFNSKLDPLTMPFFYVPGNHDIANPLMERLWKKRYGRAYYYFVYRNVLFLAVNTQDGGPEGGWDGISDGQVQYFEKAVADHPGVRWAFVFMHRPVWHGGNEEGFEKIEAALKAHGLGYTVFSGHHHTYLYVKRDGTKYFMLGTTGGASYMFGEKYGLYDHITWVTLDHGTAPRIINLKLSGLIKEDVVGEKTEALTTMLTEQTWLVTPSFVADNPLEDDIRPAIVLKNTAAEPLHVSGDLSADRNLRFTPSSVDLTVPAHSSRTVEVTVASQDGEKLDIPRLRSIWLTLNGSVRYDTTEYSLPARKELLLSWKYRLAESADASREAERAFGTSDTTGFVSIRRPEYLEDHWYWSGPSDCLIRFRITHDRKYIYLVALVSDEEVVRGDKGDLLYVDLEDKAGKTSSFTIDPFGKRIAKSGTGGVQVKDIRVKTAVDDGMVRLLLRTPIAGLEKADSSFRFNIGYHDQDDHPESHHSSIYWKPRWGTETDYRGSGTFILDGPADSSGSL